MSLKAIELQVALPRSQNVGKIQEQLQQRGQFAQDHIASEKQKEDDKKKKQVNESEETEKNRLQMNQEKQRKQQDTEQESKKRNQKETTNENVAKHPYKGNVIDFSG